MPREKREEEDGRMRMSCNGCRVLRKGCSENCSIRPCLLWIKNPESQAHATVFLAKFYGRAGLMNLLNAGPDHLRPAIFRSLLYEACGRIVNPIYGSVGLLWSGSWQLCQAAVEAVLKGAPIVQIPSEAATAAAANSSPLLKAHDIRHVSKDPDADAASRAAAELHRISKSGRTRFKRSGAKPKPPASLPPQDEPGSAAGADNLSWPRRTYPAADFQRANSHESSASHSSEPAQPEETGADCRESGEASVETVEAAASHVSQAEPSHTTECGAEEDEVRLELTLGFEPVCRSSHPARPATETRCDVDGWGADSCRMGLGLELHA